jgi:hypothetical protein
VSAGVSTCIPVCVLLGCVARLAYVLLLDPRQYLCGVTSLKCAYRVFIEARRFRAMLVGRVCIAGLCEKYSCVVDALKSRKSEQEKVRPVDDDRRRGCKM